MILNLTAQVLKYQNQLVVVEGLMEVVAVGDYRQLVEVPQLCVVRLFAQAFACEVHQD